MWSSSSHIAGGHWANTQPSAIRPMRLSNALTSTECCPQPFRHHVGGSDSSGPGRPDLCPTRCAWTTASKKIPKKIKTTFKTKTNKTKKNTHFYFFFVFFDFCKFWKKCIFSHANFSTTKKSEFFFCPQNRFNIIEK